MFGFAATLVPWVIVVTVFSLAPRLPRVPGVSVEAASGAGHFATYAVVAALIYWLYMRSRPNSYRRPAESALTAVVVASAIGLAFEFGQRLFTSQRTFQPEDLIANSAGAVTMSIVLMSLETSGSRLRLLLPSIFVLGVVLTAFTAVSYTVWNPALPYAGDHWHAGYRVVICGETQPFFPEGPGTIHTHGRGVIHIHPEGNGDEGKNANLAAFFRTTGGELTNGSMTMPDGTRYSNGDMCPDGSTGVVSVSRINRRTSERIETITKPADYVPRDLQLLLIEFGPIPASNA